MALEFKNSVKDQTNTTGTGDITILGTSIAGFQTIVSAHTDGATLHYRIQNEDNTQWEINSGIWDSGTGVLTRGAVVNSSNSNSLVNFSAGTKTVITTVLASDIVLGGISSSQLASAISDETGSGSAVFSTAPLLSVPALLGTTEQSLIVNRETTAATAGKSLTVQAGGAISGGTNLAGGNLIISSGISTGTETSSIQFKTATGDGSGSTNNNPTTKMTILGNGNVGIGTATATYQLELYGANSFANFNLNSSITYGGFRFQVSGVDRYTCAMYGNGDMLFSRFSSGGTWSGDVLKLLATGVVKIGNAESTTPVIYVNNSNSTIGFATSTTTYSLSLNGDFTRSIGSVRHTVANTAGNSLTINAGGATASATDKSGGQLILKGGISTGTGSSGVTLQGCVAGSTGTTDTTPQDMVKIVGNTLGLYNHAVATQPTCAVSPLTTITHTNPGTPDYALQDLTQTVPWGFATQDEGNTLLKVVAALQAEIADLKTALRTNGTLA